MPFTSDIVDRYNAERRDNGVTDSVAADRVTNWLLAEDRSAEAEQWAALSGYERQNVATAAPWEPKAETPSVEPAAPEVSPHFAAAVAALTPAPVDVPPADGEDGG